VVEDEEPACHSTLISRARLIVSCQPEQNNTGGLSDLDQSLPGLTQAGLGATYVM
jgi:hypothetical protein